MKRFPLKNRILHFLIRSMEKVDFSLLFAPFLTSVQFYGLLAAGKSGLLRFYCPSCYDSYTCFYDLFIGKVRISTLSIRSVTLPLTFLASHTFFRFLIGLPPIPLQTMVEIH